MSENNSYASAHAGSRQRAHRSSNGCANQHSRQGGAAYDDPTLLVAVVMAFLANITPRPGGGCILRRVGAAVGSSCRRVVSGFGGACVHVASRR